MKLPSLTVLNEQYVVERLLDKTPFARTYLGARKDKRKVVVEEYFPERLAERAMDGKTVRPGKDEARKDEARKDEARKDESSFRRGLKYFLDEAATLDRLGHSSLPEVIDRFEVHGTAYRVELYEPGASLAAALDKNNGRVSERTAIAIMVPVLGALDALHGEDLLHGGLSTKAIYLTKDRKILLTGFQGAYLLLARTVGALGEIVVPGVSPPEQYQSDGRQGPWTDVYAAGATLYRMISGAPLPEATAEREYDDLVRRIEEEEAISEGLGRVLIEALAPRPTDRIPSAQTLRQWLKDPSRLPEKMAGLAGGMHDVTHSSDQEPPSEGPIVEEPPAFGRAKSLPGREEDEEEILQPAPGAAMWKEETAGTGAFEDDDNVGVERSRAKDRPAADRLAERLSELSPDDRWPDVPRSAMMAGAVVLVVLLAGAVVLATGLFGGGGAEEGERRRDRYENLAAEGDSLYEQANYRAARQRYRKAQALKAGGESGDGHLNERLREIEERQRMGRGRTYTQAIRRGDSLRSRAEGLASREEDEQARELYQEAEEAYLTALDNRGRDSLALARMQRVNEVLASASEGAGASPPGNALDAEEDEETEEERRERLYKRYREKGDEAFESEDYEAARQEFARALVYRPDDPYAMDKIEEISDLIGRAERRRQYQMYLRRGDSLFKAKEYEEARGMYEQAVAVGTEGKEPASARLERTNRRLGEKERQEQYRYHRNRGDGFFDRGDFQQAVESYQQALGYRTEDTYVTGRIAEAKRRIEEAEEKARRENMKEGGVYTVVDQEPELVGGLSALLQRVEYPLGARKKGVEGRVYLQMTVTKDGRARDVKVLRGIGRHCNRAAIEAVKDVEFRPGKVDGEPVVARKALFVEFDLRDEEE